MNVEIKRFSDSDEDFTKATECHKKAVLSKSYVTISLLFFTKEQLAEDTDISADPYAIGCQFKYAVICLPSSSSTWFNFANKK